MNECLLIQVQNVENWFLNQKNITNDQLTKELIDEFNLIVKAIEKFTDFKVVKNNNNN